MLELSGAKNGFVLLRVRWVVGRSFGWSARFKRMSRDYERLVSALPRHTLARLRHRVLILGLEELIAGSGHDHKSSASLLFALAKDDEKLRIQLDFTSNLSAV